MCPIIIKAGASVPTLSVAPGRLHVHPARPIKADQPPFHYPVPVPCSNESVENIREVDKPDCKTHLHLPPY